MTDEQAGQVAVGGRFPNILLSLRGEDVHLHERLHDQYAVIVGCTGAFTKRANALVGAYRFVSSLIDQDDQRLAFVACMAVNDPFVLKAWARRLRITNELVFIADSNGTLTRALGLQVADDVQQQFGAADVRRCRDFVAILAPGGLIRHFYIEDYSMEPVHAILRLFDLEPSAAQMHSIESFLAKARPAPPPLSPSTSTEEPPLLVPGLTHSTAPTSLPFISANGVLIKDLSKPSVFFDYDMSASVNSVLAEPLGRGIIRITAPDDDLGSLRIELDRQSLFDPQTGVRLDHIETPRKLSAESEFDVAAVYIDCARTFPLSTGKSLATLCVVHKPYEGRKSDQRITFAIPLVAGGRDNFIATVAEQPEGTVKEPQLQLQKYISSYMTCYRYTAPCIYDDASRERDTEHDVWIVSQEVCYVDVGHIEAIRAAAPATEPFSQAAEAVAAEYGFLIAAD